MSTQFTFHPLDFWTVLFLGHENRLFVDGLETWQRSEQARVDDVDEDKKLFEIVLDRRSCHQNPPLCGHHVQRSCDLAR